MIRRYQQGGSAQELEMQDFLQALIDSGCAVDEADLKVIASNKELVQQLYTIYKLDKASLEKYASQVLKMIKGARKAYFGAKFEYINKLRKFLLGGSTSLPNLNKNDWREIVESSTKEKVLIPKQLTTELLRGAALIRTGDDKEVYMQGDGHVIYTEAIKKAYNGAKLPKYGDGSKFISYFPIDALAPVALGSPSAWKRASFTSIPTGIVKAVLGAKHEAEREKRFPISGSELAEAALHHTKVNPWANGRTSPYDYYDFNPSEAAANYYATNYGELPYYARGGEGNPMPIDNGLGVVVNANRQWFPKLESVFTNRPLFPYSIISKPLEKLYNNGTTNIIKYADPLTFIKK